MKIWTLPEIKARFDMAKAVTMIERGFVAYSNRSVQVPSAQHLVFDSENADCCIKSASVLGADTFAIKISTGFYNNPARGLPSSNGMVALFSSKTGAPLSLLQDEGWLTATRTALAGRIVAKLMAPKIVTGIGIIGTGEQGRLQLDYLRSITSCHKVYAWSPHFENAQKFATEMAACDFEISAMRTAREVAERSNLIVTSTPARTPLLFADAIQPGTHITAVGADQAGKQELDPGIVERAGAIIVDSVTQCSEYGEISHALKAGLIRLESLVEIGTVLASGGRARDDSDATQITLADLTGVAVQDAQIALSIVGLP